ncbi:GNAT family N-acetyltransferase [Xylanimonas protaetiae]|uniref:GNAT family N-acetyltransferase n=1 Tax=Xylanimonas protaetiae TaxID=2509457 RepID=A0A4P6F136_9MICO|nr:GNAT family N-acetyltransferase [Xylanimonas protaetiae]QAY69470.1 GNAT family N-acetyltransferase [Xylanimonas protaetiae]
MTEIQYRPYLEQDAQDVKAIINQAFSIDRFVKEPRLLGGALEVYLRTCLLASTYARVAVQDGRVVGILMGRVSGHERLPGRLRNRLLTGSHMARLAVLGVTEHRSLRQYFQFDAVYARLRKAATAPTTDELTLFAVDASTRGLGVGKALYDTYLDHLREHGRSDFYLYTDTRCSYGFYEKQGMTRAAAEDMTIRLDGTPETLGVFLYAGSAT